MARILVTEKIADGGLQQLRDDGHVVDVRLGLSPGELVEVVSGAGALVIRSGTQVTRDEVEAGSLVEALVKASTTGVIPPAELLRLLLSALGVRNVDTLIEAMLDEDSFVKIILDRKTRNILGCPIIGPDAPELLQEVVNAMTSGGGPEEINQGIHIHPAMNEIIALAVNSAE